MRPKKFLNFHLNLSKCNFILYLISKPELSFLFFYLFIHSSSSSTKLFKKVGPVFLALAVIDEL